MPRFLTHLAVIAVPALSCGGTPAPAPAPASSTAPSTAPPSLMQSAQSPADLVAACGEHVVAVRGRVGEAAPTHHASVAEAFAAPTDNT